MFGPGPDYHIHIVHTENLRKPPKSIIICEIEIVTTFTLPGSTMQLILWENVSFQQTFASNPLTTSVFSLLQPQIPDLILFKDKYYKMWHGRPYNKALWALLTFATEVVHIRSCKERQHLKHAVTTHYKVQDFFFYLKWSKKKKMLSITRFIKRGN